MVFLTDASIACIFFLLAFSFGGYMSSCNPLYIFLSNTNYPVRKKKKKKGSACIYHLWKARDEAIFKDKHASLLIVKSQVQDALSLSLREISKPFQCHQLWYSLSLLGI